MKNMKKTKNIKKWLLTISLFIILALAAGLALVQTRFPLSYLEFVEEHAGVFDPAFIMAVIHAESSFRYNVVSPRGAMGLMQVMEATGEEVAKRMGMNDFEVSMLFVPEYNIAIGSFYLNWLWQRFDGDLTLVLSAYNAGIGNVSRWLQDERFSDDGERLSYIPFLETRNYVQRVGQRQRIYAWLLRLDALTNWGG